MSTLQLMLHQLLLEEGQQGKGKLCCPSGLGQPMATGFDTPEQTQYALNQEHNFFLALKAVLSECFIYK